MKVLGIIPARYQSTRLPGKPLCLIDGKPMIWHVYHQAKKSAYLEEVLVATDDERIVECVTGFGGKAVLTSREHRTGTDRLAEVAKVYQAEIIVNIQGDEPLIHPEMIDQAILPLLGQSQLVMSTLKKEITETEELTNPNAVKVVTDKDNKALYFSRSLLPYPREKGECPVYKHIGLYAYKREFLLKFSQMAPTPLEKAESLEQLRVLENGYSIYVAKTSYSSIGVDTPEDLKKVEAILQSRKDEKIG